MMAVVNSMQPPYYQGLYVGNVMVIAAIRCTRILRSNERLSKAAFVGI